jgi:predicted nucleic acid-binding protein
LAVKAVLDTRFFFALYNPSSQRQEEWCKNIVLEAKRNKDSTSRAYVASCITIAELYENMCRLVGREVVQLRISSIKSSGIDFIPIDEDISERAGDLKLNSGELPMSDAIIASTAHLLSGGKLFSDDEHFKGIKNLKLSWID